MSRIYKLYLEDILRAIARIHGLMQELSETEFKAGALQTDGVLFNLMTIGEAAKNVPQGLCDLTPEISWSDIGRFRDFVVHRYFGLDMSKVLEIVQTDLSPLKVAVEKLLADIEQNNESSDE